MLWLSRLPMQNGYKKFGVTKVCVTHSDSSQTTTMETFLIILVVSSSEEFFKCLMMMCFGGKGAEDVGQVACKM
jgi:hypothetical protein